MKILNFLFTICISTSLFAQTPTAFKYQAVARDNSGIAISNQNIGFKIAILQGTSSGTNVYEEMHIANSNNNGLVNLEIGNGAVLSGDFTLIDWANDEFFLEISMDETGGTNYLLMGTSQLLSVPYAMVSERTENIPDNIIVNTIGINDLIVIRQTKVDCLV